MFRNNVNNVDYRLIGAEKFGLRQTPFCIVVNLLLAPVVRKFGCRIQKEPMKTIVAGSNLRKIFPYRDIED
jgi:hypothetical protein